MAARARKLDKSVHSEGRSTFSKLMIEARKSARLTQHELAKRLGKPQSFVAKYEGGERRIDIVEFIAIARAIGTDPVRLLRALDKRTSQFPESDCWPRDPKMIRLAATKPQDCSAFA